MGLCPGLLCLAQRWEVDRIRQGGLSPLPLFPIQDPGKRLTLRSSPAPPGPDRTQGESEGLAQEARGGKGARGSRKPAQRPGVQPTQMGLCWHPAPDEAEQLEGGSEREP